MLQYLVLLFIVLPLIDLYLLLQLADIIGIIETLLLVIFTGIVGASLVKSEGISVLQRLQSAVYMNEAGQAAVEGALLMAGGIFLLSPGIVTDLIGFSLVFSWTRQHLAVRLRDRIQNANNVTVDVQYM
jgi:UPF0716 protein FxsA